MSHTKSRKASSRLHAPSLGSVRSASLRAADREAQREQRRTTLLWGGVIAGGLVWLAWPEEETGSVLLSRSECATVTRVSQAECEAGYDAAWSGHARLAPRFDSLAQCQDQFGTCQVDPDNAMYWIPPFAGFLLGYRQRDDDVSGGGSAGGYRYTGSLPLYRERGGDFLNPHGSRVGSTVGRVGGDAGAINPPTRAITVSRSGFGSTAGARSSFGG